MRALPPSALLLALVIAAGLAASNTLEAEAVPAADLRSGVVSFDGTAPSLTTVPLFVVPTGYRFVLTDFGWTFGKYPTSPSLGSYPSDAIGVWVQDNSNNVRWYRGIGGGSSVGDGFNVTPQVSFASGLVFEPNVVVTVGVKLGATDVSWTATWSGYVEAIGVSAVETQPDAFALEAFPNPSASKVVLQFRLSRTGKTTLAIYDAKGRKIRSLEEQVRAEGWNAVEWDGKDDRGRAVPTGTYFARLGTPSSVAMEKLIQMR